MNVAIIMGRLTAAPEMRRTDNDIAVASFTVAVDRDFKDKDGNKQTDFIKCVAWRKTAEFVQKYFGKGSAIAVEGKIQVRQYEKDGEKRWVTEVVADHVHFCGSKSTSGEATAQEPKFEEVPEDDSELPF